MEQCTGCGACVSCCPQNALSVIRKSAGFFYPQVKESRCCHCGLCKECCPVLSSPPRNRFPRPEVYAAAAPEGLRKTGASGGVFSVLAEAFLGDGGAVFGARWGDLASDRPLYHAAARHIGELSALQGTKYLQSHTGSSYIEVRWLLSAGVPVLYCGTPCQIAGLYAAMGGERDGLVTCDLVCAGTPSPLFFRQWLLHLEKREGSPVCSIAFRDKSKGWTPARVEIRFENGNRQNSLLYDTSYGRGFGLGLTVRACCDGCTYCGLPRTADFTLGDFWGLKSDAQTAPLLRDNGGVSLLWVNSSRGKDVLDTLRDRLTLIPRTLEESVSGNPRLITARGAHPRRRSFSRDIEVLPFEALERRYLLPRSAPVRMAVSLLRDVIKKS